MKLIIFVLLSSFSFGQFSIDEYESKIDSLKSLQPNKENLAALNDLTFQGKYIDYELTMVGADYVLKQSDKKGYESINAYANKIKGIICDLTGQYQNSIEYYLKAIKEYEEIGEQLDVAKCEANIGMIFRRLNKLDKALSYFRNSLITFEIESFAHGILNINSNLGIIYMELKQADSSLYFLKIAEKTMKELGFFDANIYGNLGNSYAMLKQYHRAEESFLKCIGHLEKSDPNSSNAVWYYSYATVLHNLKKDKEALKYLSIAKELTGENIYTQEANSLYSILGRINYQIKNYKESANSYRLLGVIKDSIYAADNSKLSSELSEKYQSEKKELMIENLNKEKTIEETKRKSEEQKVFYLILGALLLLVIVVFSIVSVFVKINDNKKIQAKNTLIQHQKELVEEKNNEILDSIQYAKRLQDAILPNMNLMREQFVDSFVLFKPKDIVSGDFYWMETKGNLTMFAVADCTGHGVPGAMVSVVCANALNKSVNELLLTDPAKILDSTRDIVVNTFTKTSTDVKDGMDISICVYNTETKELVWAGANNPLWIIRENTEEVVVLNPDKQPIGIYDNQSDFTSHKMHINSGDSIYMFTDGYADQFGGPRGKKLKTKQFKEIIFEIKNQSMIEQKEKLDSYFEEWKVGIEQLDDVCVIGVRF